MNYLLGLDLETYTHIVYSWGALGIVSALAIITTRLLPISGRSDTGPLGFLGHIDKKRGWIIMESPILIAVLFFYFAGSQPINASVVIVGAFVAHYVHRALIYPHRIRVEGKTLPVSMVLTTIVFYSINGYLIGHYYGSLKAYPIEWLSQPQFIAGFLLFVAGFVINVQSDNILIGLRKPGESGYKIPHGGFFRLVSCPNYFGEIVEWAGFAIMAWSLPSTIYALWVSLTLFSTALVTHRWYIDQFEDSYPEKRKAVVPYVI